MGDSHAEVPGGDASVEVLKSHWNTGVIGLSPPQVLRIVDGIGNVHLIDQVGVWCGPYEVGPHSTWGVPFRPGSALSREGAHAPPGLPLDLPEGTRRIWVQRQYSGFVDVRCHRGGCAPEASSPIEGSRGPDDDASTPS